MWNILITMIWSNIKICKQSMCMYRYEIIIIWKRYISTGFSSVFFRGVAQCNSCPFLSPVFNFRNCYLHIHRETVLIILNTQDEKNFPSLPNQYDWYIFVRVNSGSKHLIIVHCAACVNAAAIFQKVGFQPHVYKTL